MIKNGSSSFTICQILHCKLPQYCFLLDRDNVLDESDMLTWFCCFVVQVTGKVRGGNNPFNLGCWTNCKYTLCGPMWPR